MSNLRILPYIFVTLSTSLLSPLSFSLTVSPHPHHHSPPKFRHWSLPTTPAIVAVEECPPRACFCIGTSRYLLYELLPPLASISCDASLLPSSSFNCGLFVLIIYVNISCSIKVDISSKDSGWSQSRGWGRGLVTRTLETTQSPSTSTMLATSQAQVP
ncbi:uncharacterized protein [Arachis hypogaea]|uniref:uncharacterized protein n=1 Tax=Arachis hypogaea TaxID=3818 RepID=UPI003B21DA34